MSSRQVVQELQIGGTRSTPTAVVLEARAARRVAPGRKDNDRSNPGGAPRDYVGVLLIPPFMGGGPMPLPVRNVCRSVAFASVALLLGLACAVAQTKGGPPVGDVDACGGRRAGT